MKLIRFSIILIFTLQLQAQKVVSKVIDASSISKLNIEGDNVFRVVVETRKTNTISIIAKVEGKHNDELVLVSNEKENVLNVSVDFQPLFKKDNDKLSAHKLISAELKIVVPEHLEIVLKSDIASVVLEGNYKAIFVELYNGSCNLVQFYGNAIVNTLNGDITVETNYAKCESYTKNGSLFEENLVLGTNNIKLNSINGNIKVLKRK